MITKVVGIRLTDYQIRKLREISGKEIVTDYVRSLIDKDIDRYNSERFRKDPASGN